YFPMLVFAPFGKDAALIEQVLRHSSISISSLPTLEALEAAISEEAGAAIVTEESLQNGAIAALGRRIAAQPPWSDFPIIVLTGSGLSTASSELAVRSRAPLGNITLLERPLRPVTLISAARSALLARRRQYEVRDHLQKRTAAEEALRRAHDALESLVEERTNALRRLSVKLLRVQDEERRRIARELHDSLGQDLTAAKISLDMLAKDTRFDSTHLRDVQQLVDRSISDTRTLSHLLHPPLLDEAGFASAAIWYVEGFGQRSGIATRLKLPEHIHRLPRRSETALFRIMQEALTNVHRHSKSPAVDVSVTVDAKQIVLTVKDSGVGLPKDVLERFWKTGNVGVGLAGIRERLKELGGQLEIESSTAGTLLRATIPVADGELAQGEEGQAARRAGGYSRAATAERPLEKQPGRPRRDSAHLSH
ncbi:MAG TPA: sensor histidine kinase, partial [Candidatus Binatia bacterium]|nr:sensor histidine kinase [Candidatus Binatia bacterium]